MSFLFLLQIQKKHDTQKFPACRLSCEIESRKDCEAAMLILAEPLRLRHFTYPRSARQRRTLLRRVNRKTIKVRKSCLLNSHPSNIVRYRQCLPLCRASARYRHVALWLMQLRSIDKRLKHSNVSLCLRSKYLRFAASKRRQKNKAYFCKEVKH